MPRLSKVTKLANARNLIAGISKRLPKRGTYRVGGETHSSAELIAILRSHLEALAEVDLARIRFNVALREERALAKRASRIGQLLKRRVRNDFGLDVAAWADFGWDLPKPPGPKTVDAKAAGVRKRRAARETKKRAS